jgi:O-antigen ligase
MNTSLHPPEKEGIATLWPRFADHAARWAVIALGFSIPISVALDNTLLVLILAGWLAGGMYRHKLQIILNNPVALSALALFVLLLAGTLYGLREAGDAAHYLGKYNDLLFIPVFLFLFRDAATRRYALYAFAASLSIVLALSYLIKAGIVPPSPFTIRDAEGNYGPVVFKLHLTHNILMAFAAFLFAWLAITAVSSGVRWSWAMLAVLAVINVTMMVQGGTGYLLLCGLALLLGFSRDRWRGLGIVATGMVALAAALTVVPGPFRDRVSTIIKQTQEWKPDRPAKDSAGFRLEFYRNTLAIIADHPIIGVGTGSFPKAYADKVRGTGKTETRNPHNEFLLIMVQLGIAGLAALLWLFWLQWRLAARLASPLECHLARGLVLTMIIGCMLNSMLLDHTEGLLYAWLTGLLYAGLKSEG